MDLTTSLVGISEFSPHFPNGKHAGLVHLVAVVTDAKVHENGLTGPHDPQAGPHREGWRKPQSAHGRI